MTNYISKLQVTAVFLMLFSSMDTDVSKGFPKSKSSINYLLDLYHDFSGGKEANRSG